MFECKLQKHWECRNVKHSSIGVESVKTPSKVAYSEAMSECKAFKHWECWNVKHSSIGCILRGVGYVVLYPGYLSQNGKVWPYGATHLYILYQPAFLYTSPIYGGLSH